jgi:hypothetical protein
MVERTNEQQKVLEKRRADLADRRKAQLEVAAQLEAQEEMGEELGKTYTSLQQEVGQIQIVFCLLLVLFDALVTVLNCGTIPSYDFEGSFVCSFARGMGVNPGLYIYFFIYFRSPCR